MMRTITLLLCASLLCCSDDGTPPARDLTPAGDLGPDVADAAAPDGPAPDISPVDSTAPDTTLPDLNPPDAGPPLPRGLKWVRQHPMFIAGLIPSMGAPDAAAVSDYLSGFKATAIHLWADGLPTEMDAWRALAPNAAWLSWVQPDGTSAKNGTLIGGYTAGLPGRVGYQIGDEPADMTKLKQMEAGLNAVRQADPDALLYVNFMTSSNVDQLLQYYGSFVDGDLVCYDSYTLSNKAYERMAKFRAHGLQYKRPYWRYLKAYLSSSSDALAESDLRWDAFSGLTYGYTGHTWFLYQVGTAHNLTPALFSAAGSYTAQKTPLHAVAGQINTELRNLGRAVTQLTSTDVRYVSSVPLVQPAGTQAFGKGAGGDPFLVGVAAAPGELFLDILVGFFVDDFGEQYVMVQNVRHEHGDWPVDNAKPGTIRLTFDFGSAAGVDKTRLLGLNRLSGAVGDVPLTSLGGSQAQLDVTLDAGNPLLFKYATSRSFVLGK